MNICGLQKTTLLDFPGHVAATVFTGGCDFRCPFCHNSELLGSGTEPVCTEADFFDFLKKRSGILEGVAVTGGEPTLQPELPVFIEKIRALGLAVKLDTNGAHPEVLKQLVRDGLLDYVAMDIKTCRERYAEAAGAPTLSIRKIEESVEFLLSGAVPFEFRTTVVKELHSLADFEKIGPWIAGADRYFLQNYKDSESVLKPGFHGCTKDELLSFLEIVKPYVKEAALRGIEY